MSLGPKHLFGLAAAAVLLVVAAAGGALVIRSAAGGGGEEAFTLEGQASRTTDLYRYVDRSRELATAIPCYCGCGPSLDHANLLDCFVLPDGTGFEPHASFCAICMGEAEEVRRLAGEGLPRGEIRTAIDQQFDSFGVPTDTP